MSTEVPANEPTSLTPTINASQDKLLVLNFEYKLIQLGEDKDHIRKVLALFEQTRQCAFDTEDEWRDFIRIWDEGLGQDSHYNAVLDLVCTADLKKTDSKKKEPVLI